MLRQRETDRGSWIWGSRSWLESFFDLNGHTYLAYLRLVADLEPKEHFLLDANGKQAM